MQESENPLRITPICRCLLQIKLVVGTSPVSRPSQSILILQHVRLPLLHKYDDSVYLKVMRNNARKILKCSLTSLLLHKASKSESLSMMKSSKSLDAYAGALVKRYSSLFTLPTQEKIILSLFTTCAVWGVLALMPFQPSYDGFALGLAFGIFLFLIAISSDIAIVRAFIRGDPILSFRRCSALSLFSSLAWLGITLLGSILHFFIESPDLWIKIALLGFCIVLMLRWIVFSTTASAEGGSILLASILHPLLCVSLILLMAPATGFNLTPSLILFLPLSISVVGSMVLLFTFLLDRVGKSAVGIPSLSLFKAFMANWTEDLNEPLEKFFESLGDEKDVEISLLAFKGRQDIKAMIIVPAVHPGPFKNVGSSLFPSMVQEALERRLQCVVSVPHGLSGHSVDLSSQIQSRKVIESTLDPMAFPLSASKATPLMRGKKNGANASCQLFGDCALVTLTLAPETMEDLPETLNSEIASEAEKHGVSLTLVIDAHNSIDGPFNVESVVNPLRTVAVASLKEVSEHQKRPFSVGASKVVPEEFGVAEGMGPGGISVIVTKVGDQKAAYVTIDGNNMISGLRERILSTLRGLGIAEGEVLTTDTHAVNGVVLTPRGYHPVGEALDQAKLIEYIRAAATKALENLEPAKVSCHKKTIPDVKVIGEEQIEALCDLTDRTAKLAKKLAVTLFPIVGIFLTALLTLV